jgi:hypothetical protein
VNSFGYILRGALLAMLSFSLYNENGYWLWLLSGFCWLILTAGDVLIYVYDLG